MKKIKQKHEQDIDYWHNRTITVTKKQKLAFFNVLPESRH